MQDLVKFVEDHLKANGSTADAASLNAAATWQAAMELTLDRAARPALFR